jgi:hypothetical protein
VDDFMFSYALIRAITGAVVMPGRNSARVAIDLGCEGGSEAVVAGQFGRLPGPWHRVGDLRRQREDVSHSRPTA